MKLSTHFRSTPVWPILILVLSISGCSPLKQAPTPTATLAATPTPENTATFTPQPTSTTTSTSTPTSTATPNQTATAQAKATQAAADAIAKIAPDLKKLGFSTDQGSLAFVSEEPLDLVTAEYNGENLQEVIPDTLKDFVIQTDVEWSSSGGLAGCAITFRAAPDYNQGGMYWFPLMRLQNAPAYDIEFHQYLKWQATLTNGKPQLSRAIKDRNGDVNRLALIVQGDKFTPYINGEKMVSGTSNKMKEGLVAFSSWQNSGKTECIFSNTWIWLLP